ncbi:SDR family oxidoreductase [candidate division KSB1 bacterium]|nr:SDR family oxidoreductase [candidate division KSB1 bacterium]
MKGTAIVTGGAVRIGRAISLALAREGFDLVVHYNSSAEEAKEVEQAVQKYERRCHLIQCDFSSDKQVALFIPRVFEFFPNCNLLVNCASIFERARFMETDGDLFDRHFKINFRTPVMLSRDFANYAQEGQIINILDTKVARNLIEYFAYTLSKKALLEFTKMAAKELAPRIRVNGICPGLILPPAGETDEYLVKLSEHVPMKSKGNVNYVVSALIFLLKNNYITGDCLYIDGGEHLR